MADPNNTEKLYSCRYIVGGGGEEEEENYIPVFSNPYPGPKGKSKTINDFKYESDLVLYRAKGAVKIHGDNGDKKDARYVVAEPYTVSFILDDEDKRRSITVPQGMLTDLTSVPWWGRWFVSRVGRHLEAAIVHDFLYIAWRRFKEKPDCADWRFADNLMFAAMEKAEVNKMKRWAIYLALKAFGWRNFKKPCHRCYIKIKHQCDKSPYTAGPIEQSKTEQDCGETM